MLTSTDLIKEGAARREGETVQPGRQAVQPGGQSVRPKESRSSSKFKMQFLLLLLSNVIVFALVYYLWTGWKINWVWDYLTVNRGMVTGIMYNTENPCAIICGKVVHEGDTVNGYRVVRIHRTKVELGKDGKIFTGRVH
jgi:hypothetical protein